MKGIIFDMDGTMVNNMMVHHRAWKRKLASLGMEMTLEEVHQSIHGVNEEIIERLFGDRFTPEERKQIAFEKEEEYRNIFLPELRLIDGLPHLLDELRDANIPLAIGSAAPPGNIDFVMDNLDLRPYFKAIMHAKSVSKGKPNPEIFEKAAAGMGIPLANCVVFEDTPIGVETALNAGCQAIVVTTTHEEKEFVKYPNVKRFIGNYVGIGIGDIFL